jgi:hypothetical protein
LVLAPREAHIVATSAQISHHFRIAHARRPEIDAAAVAGASPRQDGQDLKRNELRPFQAFAQNEHTSPRIVFGVGGHDAI